jgi:hypothetical protein
LYSNIVCDFQKKQKQNKKITQKTKPKKPNKQNKIYSKINIDKGYLPSSIYVDRGGNIGLYKF